MNKEHPDFYRMTPEREAHLDSIKYWFVKEVDAKYRQGQAEHGDDLFDKDNLIDSALEEVLDLAVYLLTLKEKIEKLKKSVQ